MNRESKIEYNRWQLLCDEARAVGIDPNNKRFNRLFRTMQLWGESLAALRGTQTQEERDKALTVARERWKKVT